MTKVSNRAPNLEYIAVINALGERGEDYYYGKRFLGDWVLCGRAVFRSASFEEQHLCPRPMTYAFSSSYTH